MVLHATDVNGGDIKIKIGTLRSAIVIITLIGFVGTAIATMIDIKNTAAQTKELLAAHVKNADMYLDKEMFSVKIATLQHQLDDLDKEVKEINRDKIVLLKSEIAELNSKIVRLIDLSRK